MAIKNFTPPVDDGDDTDLPEQPDDKNSSQNSVPGSPQPDINPVTGQPFLGVNPPAPPQNPGSQNPSVPGNTPGTKSAALVNAKNYGFSQQPAPAAPDFLINYNQEFKTALPIKFRDEIIRQTFEVLLGKKKPNCLLIGPAGTGKTAIAEEIARRIANDDPTVPDKLRGYTVYELPLTNLIKGASLLGALEENVQAVLDFAGDPKNKVILFIDEIHQLCDTNSSKFDEIAQILKPALSRGKLHTIGATTSQESQTLAKDPAFSRRFSRIIVDEFTPEQTIEILDGLRNDFNQHYGGNIVIPTDVLPSIVRLADQYKSAGLHRPDTAITLLDRTIGAAVMDRKELEQKALSDPMARQLLTAQPLIYITENLLKKTALKLITGVNKIHGFEYDAMKNALAPIKGQDDVIESVLNRLQRRDLNLFESSDVKRRPLTLLFAGGSGCGKTELTKLIAKEMTGTEPIVLNMTEYTDKASATKIIGAPPGYVGYQDNGELPFDILITNPYQVILLDEFEKCDQSIKLLFMQIFDEGCLTNAKGQILDFSRSIIIATTNAGHTGQSKAVGFGNVASVKSTHNTVQTLKKYFNVELLNRFTEILTFNNLDKETYKQICAAKYESYVKLIKQSRRTIGLPGSMPADDLNKLVTETYVPEFGARPADNAIRAYIEDVVIKQKRNSQAQLASPTTNATTPVATDSSEPDENTNEKE